MYAITGTFRAYCFDSAVTTFGTALENELDGIEGNNAKMKRQRLFDKWMDRPTQYRSVSSPTMPDHPTGDIETQYSVPGDGMG